MVYVLVENGFEETELIVPVDMLRRGGVEVKLVGVSTPTPASTRGVTVLCDTTFDTCDFKDMKMLLIPGGQPGVNNIIANDGVMNFIGGIGREVFVAAICAAPLILDAAGLLAGGAKVTCYPGCETALKDGVYAPANLVQYANIITSKGPGTAFKFGVHLLAVLRGSKVAFQVADDMLISKGER